MNFKINLFISNFCQELNKKLTKKTDTSFPYLPKSISIVSFVRSFFIFAQKNKKQQKNFIKKIEKSQDDKYEKQINSIFAGGIYKRNLCTILGWSESKRVRHMNKVHFYDLRDPRFECHQPNSDVKLQKLNGRLLS